MLTLLYFARLRESLGCDEEQLPLPEGVNTVGQLRQWLAQRDQNWQKHLLGPGVFVAVNQEVSPLDTALRGDEEVAFFPPVTGG